MRYKLRAHLILPGSDFGLQMLSLEEGRGTARPEHSSAGRRRERSSGAHKDTQLVSSMNALSE
jgi:hypothetical protein